MWVIVNIIGMIKKVVKNKNIQVVDHTEPLEQRPDLITKNNGVYINQDNYSI